MTDSSRLQIARSRQSAKGASVTDMTELRVTGESLTFKLDSIRSNVIRFDRAPIDFLPVGASTGGGVNFELYYGYDFLFEEALMNTFTTQPVLVNATSDSTITQVTNSTDTVTVAAGGASFKAGHLVRASGFTNAANNGVFRVASSSGTTVVYDGTPTLTDEAAPPAGARIKVVGFSGATADITALADGLGSTLLDFTTLGLTVGQSIKIGGTATGDKFATAALNEWVRIVAIAANKLTLDELPSGWTTDAGTGKTIKCWFGDTVRNGSTEIYETVEKAFMGQAVPKYIVFPDLLLNSMSLSIKPGSFITGSATYAGTVVDINASPIDASLTSAGSASVMNAIDNVIRIAEGGATVAGPNYIQEWGIDINNNLQAQTAVGVYGAFAQRVGRFTASGKLSTYFGDFSIYDKIVANSDTSLYAVLGRENQAYVIAMPRVKVSGDTPTATANDQDVLIDGTFEALVDSVTGDTVRIDRFEYFE